MSFIRAGDSKLKYRLGQSKSQTGAELGRSRELESVTLRVREGSCKSVVYSKRREVQCVYAYVCLQLDFPAKVSVPPSNDI